MGCLQCRVLLHGEGNQSLKPYSFIQFAEVNKALRQRNGKKRGLQKEVVTILEVIWYGNTTGQLRTNITLTSHYL